jgi:hypothetical protein
MDEQIRLLVKHIDINKKCKQGKTALAYAFLNRYEETEVIRFLKEAGAIQVKSD